MTGLPRRLGATSLIGSVVLVLACSAASAAVDPPLVSGHAEVVAQGIVDFPDGTFYWQVADATLAVNDEPSSAPDAVTFVVVDAGSVDISGGARYHLATGEAAMLPAFSQARLSTAGEAARYWVLSIGNVGDTGGVGTTGDVFNLDAAPRDVDLIRDVLATDESLIIPDQEVATLVLVTEGAVGITAGGTEVELVAGDATTMDGDVTVTNRGPDTATVVAAVIASMAVDSDSPPATSPPASVPPAPTTTTAVTTTSMAPTDSDGDGLSDTDETGVYGTDPNNPDSEGDHVMDGDEVNVYGTDPLDNDSDDDFSTDGDEINILGTDPTNPDTDGDGLIDSNEQPNGANPNDSDTDDDGFADGVEVGAGTNPADATSHP